MLNIKVLEQIKQAEAQLVLVTKYFDSDTTDKIIIKAKKHAAILALGENRIDEIIKKKIPRDFCHFIGNIQSRRISEIAKSCSVIHSLCDLKHAKIFAKQENKCKFFIQVNVSNESQKQGVLPENFAEFYTGLPKNLEIIGISGMGRNKFTQKEKIAEFQALIDIRDQCNPDWKISAGTSADYKIALEMGIEIVRVGRKMFTL